MTNTSNLLAGCLSAAVIFLMLVSEMPLGCMKWSIFSFRDPFMKRQWEITVWNCLYVCMQSLDREKQLQLKVYVSVDVTSKEATGAIALWWWGRNRFTVFTTVRDLVHFVTWRGQSMASVNLGRQSAGVGYSKTSPYHYSDISLRWVA